MATSTLTDKGQTTVPQQIREALHIKPRQRLDWSLHEDGSAIMRPQRSAVELFGSLKPARKFPGRTAERKAVARAIGRQAAKEGLE